MRGNMDMCAATRLILHEDICTMSVHQTGVFSPSGSCLMTSSSWLPFGPQSKRQHEIFQMPWSSHLRADSSCFLTYLLLCGRCVRLLVLPLCHPLSPRITRETTALTLKTDCFGLQALLPLSRPQGISTRSHERIT
jgi:hypothetical protein